MKIMLTGGAGFIGSHIAQAYFEKGFELIIVDNLSHPSKKKLDPRIKLVAIDIADKGMENIFARFQPDIVNHHAALSSVSSAGLPVFKTNTLGTLNLLNLANKYRVKKFIFASSAAVYGEAPAPIEENFPLKPFSHYGISKASAEFFINLYSKYFQTIIFRYANVYGRGQDAGGEGGVAAIFAKNMRMGRKCTIYGDGEQVRDFINVASVVKANLAVLDFSGSDTFNISSGEGINISALFAKMAKIYNYKIKPQFAPARQGEIAESVLSAKKAKFGLSWEPSINLDEGLRTL